MSKIPKKKQNIISIIIIVVGIALSFLVFGLDSGKKVVAEKVDFAKKVGVMTMGEENSKEAEVFKTAIFSSNNSAEAVSEQTGRISRVDFQAGDQVQKGQILAFFDQSNLVNSAKVALEDSQKNLGLAEDNLEKTRKSVVESLEIAKNNRHIDELKLEQAESGGDQDAVDLAEKTLDNSKDAEDKAEQDVKISINNAKIQVSQAQSTVRQNQIAYEKSVIRAPVSGIITTKNINQYDYISIGTGVAEISGFGQLRAKIFLNNFEISKVNKGDLVLIEISGKNYSGKIISLSSVANSNNNRYEVQIESLEDIVAEANQSAKIKIKLKLNPEKENSFFVPLSAVSIGQQKNTVFVNDNNQAKILEIEIGKTVGDQIEVLAGLKKGDQLVVSNNRGLRDGEKIEIQ